ncbi:hypothetical protein Purlil1_13160 [Purpureocillium lilacinum]|uniref:Uncharacterized protein n=1 Tax=Purpureocillium lilacinum TaxID=33203 RepID=A0ABR0BF27_PURLI|nr:hypothetical protein Purlil1_13160 [Purpureocillium lilacinum]
MLADVVWNMAHLSAIQILCKARQPHNDHTSRAPRRKHSYFSPLKEQSYIQANAETSGTVVGATHAFTHRIVMDHSDDPSLAEHGSDTPRNAAFQDNSVPLAQVELQFDPAKSLQEQSERSASGVLDNILSGLKSLSQPLTDALAPLLEDKVFRGQLEERYAKLERNTELRQKVAMDLLHALGSAQETENCGHDGVSSTGHDGEESLGLLQPGSNHVGQHAPRAGSPTSLEDRLSQEGARTGTTTWHCPVQLCMRPPNGHADWAVDEVHPDCLVATSDLSPGSMATCMTRLRGDPRVSCRVVRVAGSECLAGREAGTIHGVTVTEAEARSSDGTEREIVYWLVKQAWRGEVKAGSQMKGGSDGLSALEMRIGSRGGSVYFLVQRGGRQGENRDECIGSARPDGDVSPAG